jgi:hypothetical protein
MAVISQCAGVSAEWKVLFYAFLIVNFVLIAAFLQAEWNFFYHGD